MTDAPRLFGAHDRQVHVENRWELGKYSCKSFSVVVSHIFRMPSGVACAKYIPSQENACASAAPAMPTKVHSACAKMCFPVFIIFDYYFGDFLSVSKEVCTGPWHPDQEY